MPDNIRFGTVRCEMTRQETWTRGFVQLGELVHDTRALAVLNVITDGFHLLWLKVSNRRSKISGEETVSDVGLHKEF